MRPKWICRRRNGLDGRSQRGSYPSGSGLGGRREGEESVGADSVVTPGAGAVHVLSQIFCRATTEPAKTASTQCFHARSSGSSLNSTRQSQVIVKLGESGMEMTLRLDVAQVKESVERRSSRAHPEAIAAPVGLPGSIRAPAAESGRPPGCFLGPQAAMPSPDKRR
jgi:hypothetical protein